MNPRRTFFSSLFWILIGLTLLGLRTMQSINLPLIKTKAFFYIICVLLIVNSLLYLFSMAVLMRRRMGPALAEFLFWVSLGIILGSFSAIFPTGLPRLCYFTLLSVALATAARIVER